MKIKEEKLDIEESESFSDTPVTTKKRKPKSKSKEPVEKKVKKEKIEKEKKEKKVIKEKEEEEEEEGDKWWLEKNDNPEGKKWSTLAHNGPLFPPLYEPHGVKMKYNGNLVTLTPDCEEIASFFAALLGTDYANNPTFQKNFFIDFKDSLKGSPADDVIKKFEDCDFNPIFEYLEKKKAEKKLMTKEEKKKIKEEKEEIDKINGYCYLDGRKEKVGNYRIEPPGLFRGRGEHPKTGCLKTRVLPEQVTINIGAGEKIPSPPPGHQWGKVIHDDTVTWLAMWKENVNDSFKYIFLAATSSLKGQSDMKKFEKARELKIDDIRKGYEADLHDKVMATRQLATCLYFIDKLALRAGNEKGEEEADTVGCCSLRYEHITLEPPSTVIFDFLGKDSIRYVNSVNVDPQVFKNLKIFKKEPKQEGDDLFDRINTTVLNKHLQTYMAGLTAKVFRTFNASYTFQEELKKTKHESTVAEKILAYNRANREVAVLCNHQRAVAKSHNTQMEKLSDKILGIKYERQKVKDQIKELDDSRIFEDESDIDEEFILKYEKLQVELEKEKREKQLIKENEKRKEQNLSPLTSLPKKTISKATLTLEKLEKKLETLNARILNSKTQLVDKDENKQTALGTSKINYIDPRISAAWCHKFGVPLDKIFNRSLREKFVWAMDTKADYIF